jgi:3(or 17)beta-hydroxysteroid dehydrogenase
MGRLDHRTALVTGGASGLGNAVARRLASEGALVVITDLRAQHGAEAAADGGFRFIEHDVRSEQQWSDVVDEVESRCGGLHVLVNNAGIVGPTGETSPENTSLERWRSIFAVNVEGVFLGCRTAIPAMARAGGGSIINISSVAGLLATPYNTAYGASKAAVTQLTKSVAQHCADRGLGIRCNSVHPGDVHTPLWDRISEETARRTGRTKEDILKQQESSSPLGGFTGADDVAAMVAFLASDEAKRITGSMLVVDGGIVGCDTYHLVRANEMYSQRGAR